MAIQPTFTAVTAEGRLKFLNQEQLDAYIRSLPANERVTVKISRERRDRSLSQNSWYWAGILPVIAQDTGHSIEDLHEVFKRMFLVPKIVEYKGKTFRMPGSTASLTGPRIYRVCRACASRSRSPRYCGT